MDNLTHFTHWQELAEGYDHVMKGVPIMEQLIETIIRNIPKDSTNLLDLGVGTGALLEKISKKFPETNLIGLDLSEAMLEQAEIKFSHLKNIRFHHGSAHQLNAFSADTFDCIVSNYALHHLTHEEKKECAKEIYRVLKKPGKFIFGDQHCEFMGKPDDVDWLDHMLELLYKKAKHYLHSSSIDRMLLQVSLMPKFLKAEGEIMATVEFWNTCLIDAGFQNVSSFCIEPKSLLNCVMVAEKD